MATPEEFIEIADFRPGIWSDMHAGVLDSGLLEITDAVEGFLPGNGAATIENTNNCRADKMGALVPLPSLSGSAQEVTGMPDDEYGTAFRPAANPRAYLLDAELSPVRWYGFGDDPLSNDALPSVYTLWGFLYEPDGDGVASGYYMYVLGREYRLDARWQDVYDFMFARTDTRRLNANSGGVVPAGSLTIARFDENASAGIIETDGVIFRTYQTMPVMVAAASLRNTEQPDGRLLETGVIPAAEQAWLTDYVPSPGNVAPVKRPSAYTPALLTSAFRFSPSVIGMSLGDTTNNDNPFDVTGVKPADEWTWHTRDVQQQSIFNFNCPTAVTQAVAHQGRVVFPDLVGMPRLFLVTREFDPAAVDEEQMNFSDDMLWYSAWGLPIGEVVTISAADYMSAYSPLQVAEDQIAQIGVVGVLTADELLVVKSTGGGAIVRGDLDNPTVRRLPHIEPTYNTACKGTQSPIGYVYGSRTGVHLFDGSGTTRKLSRQLDGFFWDPYDDDDPVITGAYGRFAYWNGLIHVPNNFVYDIESDGWWRWRIDIGKFNIYLINNIGQLWMFPCVDESSVASPRSLFYAANIDRLASSYSWQSHPLIETRGRRVSVQDVRILGTSKGGGAATFTVTLTGYDEGGNSIASDAITLTCDNTLFPQVMREDITPNFVAEYIQVRVEAASNVANTPAPKLHSLRLGIKPRQTTPRQG